MTELINKETNKYEEVPESQIGDAVLSGKYSFRKGDRVNVIEPESGDVYSVPVEEAKPLFKQGYRAETLGEMEERKLKKEYGDKPLQTFAEGFVSGATGGISDFVAKNVSPDYAFERGQRERFNPGSAILGEFGSYLTVIGAEAAAAKGSFKGASTIAKMAELSPISMASKLGRGVEESLTKEFVKAASKSGPLGALARAAPRLAAASVEGSALSSMEGLKEYSLGDPNEIGASVIFERGLQGAITAPVLVGGFDALLGGAKMLTKPMFQKIEKTLAEKGGVGGVTQDFAYQKAFKQTGARTPEFKYLKRFNVTPEEAGKVLIDDGILKAGEMSIDEMAVKTQNMIEKDIGPKIREAYQKADEILQGKPELNLKLNKTIRDATNEALAEFKTGSKSKIRLYKNLVDDVEGQMSEFFSKEGYGEGFQILDENANLNLVKVWDDIKALEPLAKYEKGALNATDVASETRAAMYQDVLGNWRRKIYDLVENEGVLGKGTPEALGLRDLNKKYHVLKVLDGTNEKILNRVTGNNFLGLPDWISGGIAMGASGNIAVGFLTGVAQKYLRKNADGMIALGANRLAKMAAIENLQVRALAKVGKAVNSFIAKPSVLMSGAAVPMAQRMSSYEDQSKKRSLKDRYEKAVTFIRSQNDETIVNSISGKEQGDQSGPGLWNISPETMQSITQSAVQSVNFLKQNIPEDPNALGVFKESEWQPSRQQMQDFLHLYEGAMSPGKVIEAMGRGEMPVQAFTAMKQLHPVMFQMVQQKMIDQIAKKQGKDIPYEKRVAISMALGSPLEKTMDPMFIMQQQMMYAQTGQEPNRMPVGSRSQPTQKARKENLKNTTTFSQGLSKQMTL